MLSSEEKFLKELNVFRNEVMLASKFLYTELAIRNIANENKKVLRALNCSPTFWNTILSALQNSTFVTFGRIFDNNSKNSINTLFKFTQGNRDIFTKESFKNRWIKNSDRSKIDHWLPEYLKKVYVPTTNDLLEFGKFIDKQKEIYKEFYRPIRNQFGHKILNTNEDVKVLFDKIKVNELEKFCTRLESIHEALWQLYHNGRGPLLPIKQGRYSTKNILKTKFKPYVSKPANAQFIEEVTTALNLLKLGEISMAEKYKNL